MQKQKSMREKLDQRICELYEANRFGHVNEQEKQAEQEIYSYYTATDDETENNTSEDNEEP